MLDEAVVFWPAGSSWDSNQRAINFGGGFDHSADAMVGHQFNGGGGVWAWTDDLGGVLNADAVTAVRSCLDTTGASEVIFAYPE